MLLFLRKVLIRKLTLPQIFSRPVSASESDVFLVTDVPFLVYDKIKKDGAVKSSVFF